jgi:hypothetical protein
MVFEDENRSAAEVARGSSRHEVATIGSTITFSRQAIPITALLTAETRNSQLTLLRYLVFS